MIEHPVPQNITSYQFHLIGNMTIKQFLIVLAGAGIGFLFYTTNLPGLIKWSFILFFFSLGALTAFIPYEDRTLDQWIINFIKAIYRPTKFYWRRHPAIPNFLSYVARTDLQTLPNPSEWAPQKRQKVQAYLSSIQSGAGLQSADPLDIFTQSQTQITALFTSVQAAENVSPSSDSFRHKPSLQVRARPLRRRHEIFQATSTTQATPQSPAPQTTAPITPVAHTTSAVRTVKPDQNSNQQPSATPSNLHRSVLTVAVDTVETSPSTAQDTQVATDTSITAQPVQQYVDPGSFASSSQGQSDAPIPAIFDHNLPFPTLPTQPNMLVGMVHDAEQKIVSNAIIEILDEQGNTVRAMKTNALGQFYISSALKPGKYLIETEKESLTFPIYSLEINGSVLDPINIQAILK
jgi:hypothetical protein